MIALDTNILVFAHRRDSEFHSRAEAVVREFAEGDRLWAVPWPCIHEFLSIVTHPRIYKPASTLDAALQQVENWTASPTVRMLSELAGYWASLRQTLDSSRVMGPAIHDARIASICISHGVEELLTLDRDFSRFPALKVRNPLVP
jgi:toxin-antitoxin system PIN domain toxin